MVRVRCVAFLIRRNPRDRSIVSKIDPLFWLEPLENNLSYVLLGIASPGDAESPIIDVQKRFALL